MFRIATTSVPPSFEDALARAPLPAQAPLRIMIVDGHSAPLNEAGYYLRTTLSNVSIEPFAFYAYAQYASVPRDTLLPEVARTELERVLQKCSLPQGWGSCSKAVYEPQRRFLSASTAGAIESGIDLILCQFPGWQCALFGPLRVAIAVRFTHRFNHHLGDHGGVQAWQSPHGWSAMLQSWVSTGRAAIFADNGYDAEYLRFHTNISATPWPAVGARVPPPNPSPRRQGAAPAERWCFCCQPRLARQNNPGALPLKLADRLRAAATSVGPIHAMTPKPKSNASTLGASTACTAYVLLPHSLHSYTSVENYALGFPYVIPSPRLLATWHQQHSLVWHKCPGNRPFCKGRAGGPDQVDTDTTKLVCPCRAVHMHTRSRARAPHAHMHTHTRTHAARSARTRTHPQHTVELSHPLGRIRCPHALDPLPMHTRTRAATRPCETML